MQKIPNDALKIIKILKTHGFEAFIVGGCVRDLLLGKSPNDYDITTNALPEQTKALFEKTVDTGIKHGTVTVIINNKPFEVTTYRTESGYDDMRRPTSVSFVTDIKEDLSRRDFTINAMAYNEDFGLVDCFGGKTDLDRKILRAVGNPNVRFSEDALRILRLFRFASTLNFKIERKTKNCALSLCDNLKHISAERVSAELKKAVTGENVNALKPLIKKGGLASFGIKNCPDLSVISSLPDSEDLRLFALLKLCECDFYTVVNNFKLSNKQKRFFSSLESLMFITEKSSDPQIKLALSIANKDILLSLCDYKSAVQKKSYDNIKQKCERIIKSAEPYKISHLKIKGEDLLLLGLKGDEIGNTLNLLCEKVRENPILNQKEALLKLINKSN